MLTEDSRLPLAKAGSVSPERWVGSGAYHSAVPTPGLTHVCQRGGCPPSAFRLLPSGNRQELAHQRMSSRTPYFEVLDQNRWTSTCIADTLRTYSTPVLAAGIDSILDGGGCRNQKNIHHRATETLRKTKSKAKREDRGVAEATEAQGSQGIGSSW